MPIGQYVTQQQCDLMNTRYLTLKGMVENVESAGLEYINKVVTLLRLTTNSALDAVEDALDLIEQPKLVEELNAFADDLCKALDECPGLRHIVPQSVLDACAEGINFDLPLDIIEDLVENAVDAALSAIDGAMDTPTNKACKIIKAYEDFLLEGGIIVAVNAIEDMENCLEAVCGSITAGDKIADTLRDNLYITTSEINLLKIANDAGVSFASLSAAYTAYKNKANPDLGGQLQSFFTKD